ncbi:HNH endonuclease signature motif containing protein [Tsukamurella tyrosinosolvens]|uniref:HNH endonuclease signature motif containing protein n=1 Tax=Tsukamurella tyrosinosolvens TaxID=57704 RepID=UPI003F49C1B4
MQPYCLHCGATSDLTVDHIDEATWEREFAGLVRRIEDYQILCRSCNSAKGRTAQASDQGRYPHRRGVDGSGGGSEAVTHRRRAS